MAFSKNFPRTIKGSTYPQWEEIYLTNEEEEQEEIKARNENNKLAKECIKDSKKIFSELGFKPYQTDIVNMAIALFEKRASHTIYWKERKAKEKFDKLFTK